MPLQYIAGELVVNILQLMDCLYVGQFQILVNVKGNGSVLFGVQVEVNAGRVFLEVSHRFVVGDGSEV